jgi:hypothetical protein
MTSAETMSNNNNSNNVVERIDSGYSSDSALVRKRMESIQQQQKVAQRKQGNKRCVGGGSSGGKKKTKKKNKSKSNKKDEKEKKKGKHSKSSSANSYCEDDADDDGTVVSKNIKKKKNKMKSSKKEKGTTTSIIINDGYYKDYDKRLEELEKLESKLLEESGLLQKEREVLGFERESIEMQLNEEFHRCDELTIRVKELEHIVQSHKLSNTGNKYAESIDEKVELKLQYENEINELNKRLLEKDNEIEDMKHIATRDLKILQDDANNTGNNNNNNINNDNGDDFDFDFDPTNNNIADINGKSPQRLQGELLQTVAKLTEKENQLKQQSKELDLAQEELNSFRDGNQMSQFKSNISTLQQENKDLEQELSKEQTDRTTKLKEKDETITFLMNELARLKQEQSIKSPRPLVR